MLLPPASCRLEHGRSRSEHIRDVLRTRDEYADLEERTLAERKARAGVFTRTKWWLTGMDDDEN
jgi:hypothetical protein